MPIKKMRVRERDVPYITPEWKEVIRKKSKYAKRYKRLQTQESLDEMRYWRNTATRLRRRTIKNYWRTKAVNLKENSRSFYKAFSPFMSSKGKSDQDVILKVGDNTVQKQCEVAEILEEYFSRIAEDIGDIPNTETISQMITSRTMTVLTTSKRNTEQTRSNFVRSSMMRFSVL